MASTISTELRKTHRHFYRFSMSNSYRARYSPSFRVKQSKLQIAYLHWMAHKGHNLLAFEISYYWSPRLPLEVQVKW